MAEVYDELNGRRRLSVFADRDLVPSRRGQPVHLNRWANPAPPAALQDLHFMHATGRELRIVVYCTIDDLPGYLTAAVAYARALSSQPA
jgi:hypothetical protein